MMVCGRAQDVRATELDKVDLHACFGPGDLIRARVLAFGEAYIYLTTAERELGVIYALGTDKKTPLLPISWEAMRDTSGRSYSRKVAKFF